jgi:hypothetical protein
MFGFGPNFMNEIYFFTPKNGLAELVCNNGRIECLMVILNEYGINLYFEFLIVIFWYK